ncbi:hypothetical protein HPP92_008240 [Vanilla planifolia]|uniref:Pentatricopeptide repeat-containing protein n=1 Tax=Vanilla planifolia TaxID=51239 RepID=A0A835V6M8_VANPL|nr:hypothetical protein HPP92_008240 [Vanilla planifolia]
MVLRQLQSVHAAVIVTGFYSLSPNATHTALLRTLTLLRPLPLPSISLPYALSLFHSLPHPATTLVHNVLIRFHLSICPSSPLLAIRLFSRLRGLFLYPDHHSFPLAISASSRLRHIPLGQALHAQSLRFGFSGDLFVCNALISMYSSIDYLPDAYRVFVEQIQVVDTVSYNALMYGYARAGDLEMVHHLFDGMPQRDAVSWGTIISAYSRARRPNDALRLFERMQADGLQPDNVALASALSCCAQLGELAKGKAIHEYITKNKSELTVKLSTGLVDMYAKCGAINTAMNVFDASPCKNLFT